MAGELTLGQARRIAIAAQGLARTGAQARPERVTMAHLQRLIDRIGVLQIDSVNVLARAHLLPVQARLGGYDVALLDRATRGTPARPRRLMEYWAHEAALVPPSTYQLFGARRSGPRFGHWLDRIRVEHPEVVAEVLGLLEEAGPLSASAIHARLGHERPAGGNWGWNWNLAKQVLEAGFGTGVVSVAHRNAQFERVYDLTERVLPPALVGVEPDRDEAALELVRIATRAHGIGTINCFADYFRMPRADTAAAVATLVDLGELEPVRVRGWDRPTFLRADAARPRTSRARALLAPFDPLVFERRRLAELFGMHYRIGIYTPAQQRTHGYYVLPFLLGDALVARVDLKADRAAGVLLVRTAFLEEGADAGAVAPALAAEIGELAGWLGLGTVRLDDDARGDLIGALGAALG